MVIYAIFFKKKNLKAYLVFVYISLFAQGPVCIDVGDRRGRIELGKIPLLIYIYK